jgi:hypothetical protein
MDARVAMVFVQVENCLAIAAGRECVPLVLQRSTKLFGVVHLAVGDQDNGSVLAHKGLPAGFRIHDRKARHPESNALIDMKPFAVRTSMTRRIRESAEIPPVLDGQSLKVAYTEDAAHGR